MRLVLEIKNERDLTILLPLLERLNIPFSKTVGKSQPDSSTEIGSTSDKNFDIERLERLFDELQTLNAFDEVKDPAAWQKQIRDGMELNPGYSIPIF